MTSVCFRELPGDNFGCWRDVPYSLFNPLPHDYLGTMSSPCSLYKLRKCNVSYRHSTCVNENESFAVYLLQFMSPVEMECNEVSVYWCLQQAIALRRGMPMKPLLEAGVVSAQLEEAEDGS